MIVITLFFLIQSYLEIGQCSSCKLKNTENNLLTMAIGETFRLPLSTYFSGEGLTFELSQDSGFEVSNHMWGPGKIIGNIISITSLSVNNNPYIQSFQYFALTQQSLGSEYCVDDPQVVKKYPFRKLSANDPPQNDAIEDDPQKLHYPHYGYYQPPPQMRYPQMYVPKYPMPPPPYWYRQHQYIPPFYYPQFDGSQYQNTPSNELQKK